jgi:hypothetical protein
VNASCGIWDDRYTYTLPYLEKLLGYALGLLLRGDWLLRIMGRILTSTLFDLSGFLSLFVLLLVLLLLICGQLLLW